VKFERKPKIREKQKNSFFIKGGNGVWSGHPGKGFTTTKREKKKKKKVTGPSVFRGYEKGYWEGCVEKKGTWNKTLPRRVRKMYLNKNERNKMENLQRGGAL